MYRQYEDPYTLEEILDRLDIEMQEAIAKDDEQLQIEIALEIAEIRDRINYAWQDDEYDSYE